MTESDEADGGLVVSLDDLSLSRLGGAAIDYDPEKETDGFRLDRRDAAFAAFCQGRDRRHPRMDKKHRHDLQRNDLREVLLSARDYLTSHQAQSVRTTILVVAALVVAGAVWGGISWRQGRLGARLSVAIGLLDAPLASEGAAPAGQRVFKDASERSAAAKEELKKLATDAPSSLSGQAAALLVMGLDGPKGVSGGALDAAKALAKGGAGGLASGVAFVSMLDAQAATGREKEALETAKKALDSGDAPVPKDVLLVELGRLAEKSGKPAEAKTYYQRVMTDYPDSAMRAEAQQRSQGL